MATGRRAKSRAKPGDDLPLGTDKLYFKIGEVAQILGVATHVLRFWETEFPGLRPQKSRSQQRVYRRQDVGTLLRIKHLLYVDRFTIEGARKRLRQGAEHCPMAQPSAAYAARQSIARVRQVIDDIEALITSEHGVDPAAADPAAYLRRAAEGIEQGDPGTMLGGPARALVDRPPRDPA